MQYIESIDDPRIAHYRSLREQHSDPRDDMHLLSAGSRVIVESEKVVRKALESDIVPQDVLGSEALLQRYDTILNSRGIADKHRYCASEQLLRDIVGYKLHQNILLCVYQPPEQSLEELDFPILALNSLADSENMGALVRSARAFGFNSLIIDDRCTSPWLRRAVRVSMGTIFGMKVHRCQHLGSTLRDLRVDRNAQIVVAELGTKSQDIRELSPEARCVLVVGSEAQGVEESVQAVADFIAHIPISEHVDSLNVAAATAILCWYCSPHILKGAVTL